MESLQKIKENLAEAAKGQDFIAQAPVVFVSCADFGRSAARYGTRGKNLYAVQDATIATQNMWLTATEIGLAACWVGAFDEKKVAQIFSLEKDIRPIAILPIGYPAESPIAPSRRKISEISKKF